MNRLYKKNKVNPFMTLIVLVVQFPVFICVWGALSGSAQLTNGTILGLNLSHTIRQVLLAKTYWTAAGGYAAVTALFLFLRQGGGLSIPRVQTNLRKTAARSRRFLRVIQTSSWRNLRNQFLSSPGATAHLPPRLSVKFDIITNNYRRR